MLTVTLCFVIILNYIMFHYDLTPPWAIEGTALFFAFAGEIREEDEEMDDAPDDMCFRM